MLTNYKLYNRNPNISINLTSKGTWTVFASRKNSKGETENLRFTGLKPTQIGRHAQDAYVWLIRESS